MAEHQTRVYTQTSRIFCILFPVEWVACIAAALGNSALVRPQLAFALLLASVIAIAPFFLTLTRPASAFTRYVVAIGQMLMSALLIHLTGGRMGTHFLVFISLAILAFYRDWRLLIPATFVIVASHATRGLYFPAPIIGTLSASPWRWLEDVTWIIFENVILFKACLRGTQEMWEIAARQASIEAISTNLEDTLQLRTAERDEARVQAKAASADASRSPFDESLHRLSRVAEPSRQTEPKPATKVNP